MPSEQPREGTQERYIDQWPKPMFLCTHCDEQTDSDPCQECASVFDERGENYPPVLRFQVVPAPAQPEQPPGLPDTGQMSAEQIIENLRAVESMAGSLASQMETNLRMNRWREHLGDDPLDGFGGRGPAEYHYMATHEPEGPGLTRFGNLQLPDDPGSRKVDPEQLRLVRNMAKIEASQSDPEQAPAFTDERRASHRRRADALNAVLAALEPAPPTPTEQENDR